MIFDPFRISIDLIKLYFIKLNMSSAYFIFYLNKVLSSMSVRTLPRNEMIRSNVEIMTSYTSSGLPVRSS